MNTHGVVLIPANIRAEMLECCLDSVVQAQGFKQHVYIIYFDRNFSARSEQLAQEFSKQCDCQVIYRAGERSNLSENMLRGMLYAGQHHPDKDWLAVVEEDVIVHRDFFRYVDYCIEQFDDKKLYSVNACTPPDGWGAYEHTFTTRDPSIVYRWDHFFTMCAVFPMRTFREIIAPEISIEDYYRDPAGHCKRRFPGYPDYKEVLVREVCDGLDADTRLERRVRAAFDRALEDRWFIQAGLLDRIRYQHQMYSLLPEVARAVHIGVYSDRDVDLTPKQVFDLETTYRFLNYHYYFSGDHDLRVAKLKEFALWLDQYIGTFGKDMNWSTLRLKAQPPRRSTLAKMHPVQYSAVSGLSRRRQQ